MCAWPRALSTAKLYASKRVRRNIKEKILDLALRPGINGMKNSRDPEEVLTSLGKFGLYV
jgi:hypothetical protein